MKKKLLLSLHIINRAVFLITALFFIKNNFAAELELGQKLRSNASLPELKDFHESLCGFDPQWFRPGIHAFYKEIAPITSQPGVETNQWTSSAYIAGQNISPQPDGTYKSKDGRIHFRVNPSTDFLNRQKISLLITRDIVTTPVELSKSREEKIVALSHFNNFQSLATETLNKGAWWTSKQTFEGVLPIPDEEDCAITIESVGGPRNPVIMKGFEVAYRKDESKTKLFFNFTDCSNRPLNYFQAQEFKHQKLGPNKKLFRVKHGKLYECSARDVTYQIFDLLLNKYRWIEDISNFYDFQKRTLTLLPDCYAKPNDHPETPVEPAVFVLGERHDCFYELENIPTFGEKNNHLYSDGKSLFATLACQISAKEYLAEQNRETLRCLLQILKPTLSLNGNVVVEGGHRPWPEGIYCRIPTANKIVWRKIASEGGEGNTEIVQYANEVADEIEERTDFISNFHLMREDMSAEESKRWCGAAQRFFGSFYAVIPCCDRSMLNGLRMWDKLNNLDLSHVKLEGGLQWDELLMAVGAMGQLKKFSFCNNNPVTNFDDDYEKMANRASAYYRSVAACLRRLENLQELQIQGLWLKPCHMLGYGAFSSKNTSKEVAILTSVINHDEQRGVGAIINSICALTKLKKLSTDGIPNSGNSWMDRKHPVAFIGLGSIPLAGVGLLVSHGIDSYKQGKALKTLATLSAANIARMPLLRICKVYFPGGYNNEHGQIQADYFSKFFREKIATSRPNNLFPLTVESLPLG